MAQAAEETVEPKEIIVEIEHGCVRGIRNAPMEYLVVVHDYDVPQNREDVDDEDNEEMGLYRDAAGDLYERSEPMPLEDDEEGVEG